MTTAVTTITGSITTRNTTGRTVHGLPGNRECHCYYDTAAFLAAIIRFMPCFGQYLTYLPSRIRHRLFSIAFNASDTASLLKGAGRAVRQHNVACRRPAHSLYNRAPRLPPFPALCLSRFRSRHTSHFPQSPASFSPKIVEQETAVAHIAFGILYHGVYAPAVFFLSCVVNLRTRYACGSCPRAFAYILYAVFFCAVYNVLCVGATVA